MHRTRQISSVVPRLSRTGARQARRQLHQKPDLASTVQITTLPNKIRVATEATPGHFSSVGVYIDAGSRYEWQGTSGVSHMLDRLAFKSTANRSFDVMSKDTDSLGGQILCSSSRESIMYQSSHFHAGTPLALSLIADTIRNPLFLPEELEAQQEAARYEIREINTKPEMIIPEYVHQVAYRQNTLGNPLLCPEEQLDVINGDMLKEWTKTWYRPERIVVAGAGMDHQYLVELADKHFSSLQASPTQGAATSSRVIPPHIPSASKPSLYKSMATAASSLLYPTAPDPTFASLSTARANYTGGHLYVPRNDLDFDHLYLAFEGVSIHDEDVYVLATMQILLGGGGSFSAGGPGKGMYSRLYTHILNHNPQIDHCASFHHIYSDSSLFGLFASYMPSARAAPTTTLAILAHQIALLLTTPVPSVELSRAKNQLQSSLVMALESRAVEVEDLGRQILVHGRKIGVEEMCKKIQAVEEADILRVAQRVFGRESKQPTVVVMGTKDVQDWKSVLSAYGVGSGA